MISEWTVLSSNRNPSLRPAQAVSTLSINERILAYLRHAKTYNVKDDRTTSEQDNVRQALRFLSQSVGTTGASDFDPLAHKVFRRSMSTPADRAG